MRNGATVALNVGDAVYQSDVIQTGSNSSVGIGFPDGAARSTSSPILAWCSTNIARPERGIEWRAVRLGRRHIRFTQAMSPIPAT